MPSPFPGMDPYLEDPTLWPDVHQRLITYIADALQPHIRPRYHARIGERLYVVEVPHIFYPDVVLVRRPAPAVVPVGEEAASAPEEADAPFRVTIPPLNVENPSWKSSTRREGRW